MFCKYKDTFGKPRTGIHSLRFLDVAVWDVVMTIIVSVGVSLLFNIRVVYTMAFVFLLGIFLHRLFCVQTKIDTLLFKNIT